MDQSKDQTKDQKKAPAAKSTLVKRRARAIASGFANNQLYFIGDEFELVVDESLRPPSWVEFLDEKGIPVAALGLVNAAGVEGEKVATVATGFAAGQPAGSVI